MVATRPALWPVVLMLQGGAKNKNLAQHHKSHLNGFVNVVSAAS
jgi:hypothetical protein